MGKKVIIKYGKGEIAADLNCNAKLLEIKKSENIIELKNKAAYAFKHPIGSGTISEIVRMKKPEKIVIIINDITRPTPNDLLLRPMLMELDSCKIPSDCITLLVATGMHRPMTSEEIDDALGSEIAGKYRCVNHIASEAMTYMGELEHNIPLYINPVIPEADLVMAVGVIAPHYMAGYSGGRKSILPGVTGLETIQKHHALMCSPDSKTLRLKGNPFNDTMIRAASMSGLAYIANAVVDSTNEVVDIVTGDYFEAWNKGVEICEASSVVRIEELADGVIVSPGGYPKDINMYQAQKAIENASYCVKPGKPIILLAECIEGLGEETFARWLEEADSPESMVKRIKENFELGGHKAYSIAKVLIEHPIYIKTMLSEEIVKKLYMESFDDLTLLSNGLFNNDDLIYIMSHASNTVPMLV